MAGHADRDEVRPQVDPEAQSNPEWDGSDDIPQQIAAKPDAANDFCILYWSWKNVGKVPASTDFAGDLMIGDEQQHAPARMTR